MTDFLDSSTFTTITTVSGTDVAAYIDAAAIPTRTQIIYNEQLFKEANVIVSVTTPSGVDVLFRDAATIGSVSSFSAVEARGYTDVATFQTSTEPSALIQDTTTVHTTDYDNNPWTIVVTMGGYPTAGSIGTTDDDGAI